MTARDGSSCRSGTPRRRARRIPRRSCPGGRSPRWCARTPTPGRVSRRTPTRPTSRALCGRSGRASNWGDRGTSRRAGDKDSRRRPRPRQPARNGPATAAIAAGGRSRRSGVAREPAYVVDIGVVGVTCPSIRACRDHDRHPQVEADIDSVYIGAIHWAKASARRTIGEGVSSARNGYPRPPARIPHARL